MSSGSCFPYSKPRHLTDFTFLIEFYRHEVALGFTVPEKRVIMKEFMLLYANPDVSEFIKTGALRYIVLPMLKPNLVAHAERTPKETEA